MEDHGERNKPLLVTEYGILYGSLGISTAQINAFMLSTFDYLFDAQSESTGYPGDENRLVQGWVWYSLNDNSSAYHHGALFDSTTNNLTAVGDAWHAYVSDPANPLASLPQRNLLVTNLRAIPNPVPVPPGGSRSVALRVDVANSGNTTTTTGDNIVVKFWDGVPDAPGSNIIASRTIEDIPGCGQFRTVEAEWQIGSTGEHTWYAEVEPIAEEPIISDNIDSDVITGFEANGIVYLPVIIR
jgi:hypothetical protein